MVDCKRWALLSRQFTNPALMQEAPGALHGVGLRWRAPSHAAGLLLDS